MRLAPTITAGVTCAIVALAATPPLTGTTQDPGPGEAIFKGKGNCFTCHGPQATGTTLAPDLTDHEWVNFDARPAQEEVETLVREGVSKPVQHPAPMPPMGGARLSDQEVSDVAAYVLWLSAESHGGEG